jgi:hypothetical protein
MRELKNYEDLTLHYPLVPADFLISKDNLELLSNSSIHNSCRCEPIRINRIAETVLKSMEHADKLARSAQQKRGPPIRQLHLCANKRQKKENSKFIYFASMQDLRGSSRVDGNFDKNDEIFDSNWDFIIVDEAHEGTRYNEYRLYRDEPLFTEQEHFGTQGIRHYIDNPTVRTPSAGNDKPEVYPDRDGDLWINEGHHRIIASRLRGEPYINVFKHESYWE